MVRSTDDITIPELIAWLETKPPGESYSYVSPTFCLMAQFLVQSREFSVREISCGVDSFNILGKDGWKEYPFNGNKIINSKIVLISAGHDTGYARYWDFGSALARAKK